MNPKSKKALKQVLTPEEWQTGEVTRNVWQVVPEPGREVGKDVMHLCITKQGAVFVGGEDRGPDTRGVFIPPDLFPALGALLLYLMQEERGEPWLTWDDYDRHITTAAHFERLAQLLLESEEGSEIEMLAGSGVLYFRAQAEEHRRCAEKVAALLPPRS